jgi:hypothetical protein
MNKILLAFCLTFIFIHTLNAQSDVEKKLKQEIWVNAPAEFKNTEIPEKWKNESAVVLAVRKDYTGDRNGNYYIEKANIHFRIKLLDKAALSDFSEMAFNDKTVRTNLFGKASAYRIIGIKIIKPTGIEKEVDLTQAVRADAGSSKELKIPIPNLEMGDIIDYFIAVRVENLGMPTFGDEMLLEGKYPIMSNINTFYIPNKIQFQSYSYNGAPEFKKELKNKDALFTLKDEMREKAPNLLWEYEYQTSPHIRYIITDKVEKPNSKKGAEDLLKYFDYGTSDIGFLVDFFDGNFKKEKDARKIVHELYYALRNPIYMKAYFNIPQGEPLSSHYTPDQFFVLMHRALTKYKIDHEMMLVPSRRFGPLDRLVNFSSSDFLIRVNTTPPIYISRPTPFSIPNEIAYPFEGMEGVSKPSLSTNRVLTKTSAEENITTMKLAISIKPGDLSQLNIKRSVIAKGHNKDYHQYLMFTNYDYLKSYDLPKYQAQRSSLLRGIIKEYNNEKIKFEQRITQDYNNRDTRIKRELENDMDVKIVDYKNLSIRSIGMWDTDADVEYTDEFLIENITKKAGPNILVELGKLIEKQTELKEDQKNRSRDVYMDYARTYSHEIIFTIPDGYTIEGHENLNKNTENALGGFISSAKKENNILFITAKKYYKENYYRAADWLKVTSFLTSAVDFYNSKLLLKKK